MMNSSFLLAFSPFKLLYILCMFFLLLIAIAAHKEKREKLFVVTLLFMLSLSLFYSVGQTIVDFFINFKEAFRGIG
ncbi:hypothetical protein [Candidatus Enterococcus clewellii]|uniref:Uncharacterized protein n=1 Tax=Candidatus Enterococcus clewellii TaxID=1834193 RepID=A0A242KE14_9ENTE|nr:hypothetical protein [Enterococcus sp. 9E7_DIV0242]OTP19392.1 hypothetical protein A5888_001209 [Enterococcus sp. 9E7_DIV0242]